VSDANMKVEVSTNTPNAHVEANEKRGFDMPLFAMPGIFRGIAEQGLVRARDKSERIKAASGEIADILRKACSTNAKGAGDYGVKVIEISGVNTNSAFDFLTNLMDTKSLSEIMQLSATQSRKNFEVTSAQNKELWELAQKVATKTAEPIKEELHQSPAESLLNRTFEGRRDRLEQAPPATRGAVQPIANGQACCDIKAKQGGLRWASL
jgi:phasin